MSLGVLEVGAEIPLQMQLSPELTDKYIRVTVKNAAGDAISGSPVTLTHETNGLYTSAALTMPNSAFVRAQYEVFDDVGFTQRYANGYFVQTFIKAAAAGGGSDSCADAFVLELCDCD